MSDVPAYLAGLVDDAAIFPPGNAPLDRALAEHGEHRRAEYAELVGGFVVSDVRLPELHEILDAAEPPAPLALNVVVTGGAGAIAPAAKWATRGAHTQLSALEIALRDLDDLPGSARRVITAVDALEEESQVYVELPTPRGGPGHGWLAALDELAARELRVKLRTGGVEADSFPTSSELAASIDAALDRELTFKCTAGLHNAVRHLDPETGFDHHGFLNVLLATDATLAGGDPVAVLEERDPLRLVALLDPDEATRTRRWFHSFGSCSVLEPHEDLVELGLLGGTS